MLGVQNKRGEIMKSAMFIDDDEHYHYVIKKLKQRNKIPHLGDVIPALNGREALEYLLKHMEEELPDAIFIDINMPVMNGFEFLEKFKQEREKHTQFKTIIPIAVITSSTSDRDKNEIERHSIVDEYLVKDVDINELANKIDKLLV